MVAFVGPTSLPQRTSRRWSSARRGRGNARDVLLLRVLGDRYAAVASPLPSLRQGHAHGERGISLPDEGCRRLPDALGAACAAASVTAGAGARRAPRHELCGARHPPMPSRSTALRGVTRHRAKVTRGGAAVMTPDCPPTAVARGARRDPRGLDDPTRERALNRSLPHDP